MHHAFRLLINGRLVPGTGTAPVINPATGTPFADRPVASRGQLDEAVASAKAAQPGWAANPYAERRRVLEKKWPIASRNGPRTSPAC
ncbi:aldehyde dehydrogenase family protein [Ancylobacter dichloromethanicus]